MKCTLKRKDELLTNSWGGGSTTELFIYPPKSCYSDRNFEVRVSSATVETTPSVFTSFLGCHRLLMPLNASLKLSFEERGEVSIDPFEVVEFESSWKTVSNGICTDVGVMLSPKWSGNISPVSEGVFSTTTGFTGIYSLCDNIKICADKDYLLMKGDFLIIETEREQEITSILPDKNTAVLFKIQRKNTI